MLELKFSKRLSETGFMENLDFSKPFKVMIDAPTGSGKTYYVVNYLKENNIPFVFLVDTLLLMKQISNDYDVSNYYSQNKDTYNHNQLVSVYNHIQSLYKGKVVIIDEAHSLVTDYSYKREIIENLLTFAGEAEQVIMLSGTPIISNDVYYEDVEVIKCSSINPKKYNLETILSTDSKDKLNKVLSIAKDMKDRGIIPVISLLDTKDKLNDLMDLLVVNGFTNVGMINSVVKDGEMDLDSSYYNQLVGEGIVDADCIVTTYVQGYNINNTNCGLIIYPTRNKHSYISIAQMIARFRNIDNLESYLVVTESKEEVNEETGEVNIPKPWYNFNKMYNTILESTTLEVTNHIDETKKDYKTNRAIKMFVGLNHKLAPMIDENLQINNQMVALTTLNKITNLMYSNNITANTVLNQYNINLKIINPLNNNIDMEKNNTITVDYKVGVVTFFNNLEVGRIPQTKMNLDIYKAYKELLDDYRLTREEIRPILEATFGNKKEYERVKLSISFRTSDDINIKKMRKEIFQHFQIGQWYSSTEIKQLVGNIITDNGGLVSSNRATEVLNFLFETETSVLRIEGKNTRGLTIKMRK